MGSPTNMGVISWRMKKFRDAEMAPHWMKIDGKIGCAFRYLYSRHSRPTPALIDKPAPVLPRTPPRYAPAIELPPYSYVPGHGLPHPVNDPAGHLFSSRDSAHEPPVTATALAALPIDPTSRRRALAATLATNSHWLYALDLFNAGYSWEAHEAWESFWNAFGRTTPEAQFVQGLIHLAAACVKVREGKPAGVSRHTKRARELLGDLVAANPVGTLGLDPGSLSDVVAELEKYAPACWHTSKTPVVRVLAGNVRLAG